MARRQGLVFEPISRQTVSNQVRDQLLDRITTGELSPGGAIPSERLLSEQFGVARTSVREAMQGLVSIGVVERRGNRAYVTEHLPEVSVEADDSRKEFVRQLFETRRVLEVPIFELAGRRATDRQRTELARLALGFDPGLSLEDFRRLDRQFHSTVAAACGNPLLVEVHGKVLDALFRSEAFESLLSARANEASVATLIEVSGQDHRAIADAFMGTDPTALRDAVESHLDNVERRMLDELV